MVDLLIRIKRVYEPTSKDDCYRILIDRLWPRGLSKEKAGLNTWIKQIAPSDGLRQWFGHDPEKWEEFRKKYGKELREKQQLLNDIKRLEKENGTITLVYSAKGTEHNNAVALKQMLEEK